MTKLALLVWGSQTILTGVFKNASFGSSPNLHKCISHVEVYRFGQCLGWRFSPKLTFLCLVQRCATRALANTRGCQPMLT